MIEEYLARIISPGQPFFGGNTQGFQGDPRRHVYMAAAAFLVAPNDRPMRILEIGSWIGASALTWAEAIATFCPQKGSLVCVDMWSPYLGAEDIAAFELIGDMDFMARTGIAYSLFRHNIKFAKQGVSVQHVRMGSQDILPILSCETFDLIYIDGSHYYSDVYRDIIECKKLLRIGGILCGDDLEVQFKDCDQEFARANGHRDYLRDPRTGVGFHPGVTCAVYDTLGEVFSLQGFWGMRKDGESFSPISTTSAKAFIPSHFPEGLKVRCRQMLSGSQ